MSHVIYIMSHTWGTYVSHMTHSHVCCSMLQCVAVCFMGGLGHIVDPDTSFIYEWVMSHIWTSLVTRMNDARLTYEWVMSHIWMCQVTQTHIPWVGYIHMNESCHTDTHSVCGVYNVPSLAVEEQGTASRWQVCIILTRQCTATHYNTLQHTATHCNMLERTASQRQVCTVNTLQHSATCCNLLQHISTYCKELLLGGKYAWSSRCNTL